MLSVSNVSMRYGAKVLFEDVSVSFVSGRRYGLTGPNGSGKSTFMKVLTGELDAQKGTVVRPRKFGVLRQDQFAFDAYRVIDTVIMGNKPLWAALEERDRIYEKPELSDADGMRLGELEGVIGDEDGYTAEADAAVLLDGLDIREEIHDRKMSELQGGQKVRVLLAQALFGKPEATSPPTTSISNPSTGSRTSSRTTTAPSSASPTIVTSSTPSPPTPPTSITKLSSSTPAATTTW
jgi:ATPase subunit of ABC transporter with duplicated ATPase domains